MSPRATAAPRVARITAVVLGVVLACGLATAGTAAAAPAPSLSRQLTLALRGQYLPPGRTAAIAVDLDTGRLVYAHNEGKPVVPASNEKLPVAWTALVTLGPAYRFHTELYGTGTRTGATWNGDLVLKGFGDPTLARSDLTSMARRLLKLGITTVTGRVRGDESFYDRARGVASWKLGFLGIESPPLSALVVDRAKGWPSLSPPLLAAKALTEELERAGVHVSGRPGVGRAPASAVPLVSDRSAPLGDIVRFMNHQSDNFTAEMLLKQLGAATGEVGTTAGGAAVVLRTLKQAGIPTAGLRLLDGSGLSPGDRVSAETLVRILEAGWHDPEIRDAFVRSLAAAGTSGTMRNRLPALGSLVRAKTGTTDYSCSLSGFVGTRYAFAVVENGSPVAYWTARQAQDRFVTLLAAQP